MTDDVEENNNASSEPDKGITITLHSKELHIAQHQIPFFLIIAAAIVLLICSIQLSANKAYAIIVACVAMAVAFCALLLTYMKEDQWKIVCPYVVVFLLLWNSTGTCILTFDGPFQVTGNGYFASWALCLFAFMAAGFSYGSMLDKVKSSPLGYLMVASIVVAVACIFSGLEPWRNIFSLIVAIFTVALCGFFIYMDQQGTQGRNDVRVPLLVIFSCLWVMVVAILTSMKGPFPFTGNGYFGAWAGLICCVWATFSSFSS